MASNYVEWDLRLFDVRRKRVIDDDSGVCNVLTAGTPEEKTLYSDDRGTSQANPVTFTNGRVRFFMDSSVTSVDLAILTAKGHAVFMTDVSNSERHVLIDPDKREQTLIVPFFAASTTDPVSTGFAPPVGCLIKEAGLLVTTAEASTSVDVGADGDADGLLDDISLASTGVARAAAVATAGANIDFLAVSKYGALLADELATAGDTVTQNGAYARKYHATTTATNITYSHAAATNLGKGYIFIEYTRLNDIV